MSGLSTPELRVEQFRSGRRMAKGWSDHKVMVKAYKLDETKLSFAMAGFILSYNEYLCYVSLSLYERAGIQR